MFQLNKLTLLFSGILLGFIGGQIWNIPYKFTLKQFFLSQYGEHVFLCDNAMRQHFIAKSRVVSLPGTGTINSLKSAELGLIDCHEYDKFRKKLITYGLNENDLSEMGLKAIEKSRTDLRTLVEQHEISY
tara:strand:+ start:155 stop:544 length:390 start_codon:yes stop_codon:yes gene_type:complete